MCRTQCSMPVRLGNVLWLDTADWQSQTSSVCSEMTGQWSDRLAMSSHKTLTSPDAMSYLQGLTMRIWTLFWRREGLHWYRHVECSNDAIKTAFDIQVDGKRRLERSKMTWQQLTVTDCREWKLLAIVPHDRHIWYDIYHGAASQLPGRVPTDVDVARVPAC